MRRSFFQPLRSSRRGVDERTLYAIDGWYAEKTGLPGRQIQARRGFLSLSLGASTLRHPPMKVLLHIRERKFISGMTQVTAWVGLLMILTFPVQRPHQFTAHFRGDEMRRSVQRHTSLAESEAGSAERIAQRDVLPAIRVPVTIPPSVSLLAASKFRLPIGFRRLLLRLKLGPSGTCAPDPLI
jgi:hypothetical protein